jgi:hypothetical protein
MVAGGKPVPAGAEAVEEMVKFWFAPEIFDNATGV